MNENLQNFNYEAKYPDIEVLDAIKKYENDGAKDLNLILSLINAKYMVPLNPIKEDNCTYAWIKNKITLKKYIVVFSTDEELKKWKEKKGINKIDTIMNTIYMIYQPGEDSNEEISGIVIDPCTSSIIIEKEHFIKKETNDNKIVLNDPTIVPDIWLKKLIKFFKKTTYVETVYLKVLDKKDYNKYVLIIDFDDKQKEKMLYHIGEISTVYADLPVAIISIRKNPQVVKDIQNSEPIYKKK